MKKNKFAMISVTFLLGAVFGISLFAVLSFSSPGNSPSPVPSFTVIDTTTANKYLLNYLNSTGLVPVIFKGFLVDRLQLDAMNDLVLKDGSLYGFRLYMGRGDKGDTVSMIVGVGSKLSEKTSRVYKTSSVKSGPCPFICDESSPIIKNSH